MAVTHTYYKSEKELVTTEITPMKAIRLNCLSCSNWQPSEVKRCDIKECSLWPYRMGRRQA